MTEVPVEEPVEDPDLDPEAIDDVDADDEMSEEEREEEARKVEAALAEIFPDMAEPSQPNNLQRIRGNINRIAQDQAATELVVMGESVVDHAESSDVPMSEAGSSDAQYNTTRPDWMGSDYLVRRQQNRTTLMVVRSIAALVIFGGAGAIAWLTYRALVEGKFKPDSPYGLPKTQAKQIDAGWRAAPDSKFFGHVAACAKSRGLHQPLQAHLAFELARAFPEHDAPLYSDGQVLGLVQQLNDGLDALRAQGDEKATVYDVLARTQLSARTVDGKTVPLRRNQACAIAELAVLRRINPEAFASKRLPGPVYAVAHRASPLDENLPLAVPAPDGAHYPTSIVRWTDWPPLANAEAALEALPPGVARSLRVRADEYAALARTLLLGSLIPPDGEFKPLDGTGRVTALAEAWHGLPAGSLAYTVELAGGGELCFVRDDVLVDAASGDVMHVDFYPPADHLNGAVLAKDLGTKIGDSVFTLGEYASFLLPGGPLIAGVVHVFRSLLFGGGGERPKPKPHLSPAEALAMAAGAYISSRVEEFQAVVQYSYRDYCIADIQVDSDEKISRIQNLRDKVHAILDSDDQLSSLAVLENDTEFRRRGAMAWAFAKQFQLLLLRKAAVLDGWWYQQPEAPHDTHKEVSDSPKWAELANELVGTLGSIAVHLDLLHADSVELASHVVTGPVEHKTRSHGRYVVNGYYFTDSKRPDEQLGLHLVSKDTSLDSARGQAAKAKDEYIITLQRAFYRDRYGLDDPKKLTELRDTMIRMQWSVLENFELFIVPCAVGWESGDDLPALGTWPALRDGGVSLEPKRDERTVQWSFAHKFGPNRPEVASGYLPAESPVIGFVRAGQGAAFPVPASKQGDKPEAYAVQVRCYVPDEASGPYDARGRELLIRWTDLKADHESSQRVLVPPTPHAVGDESWTTRTVTVPLPPAGERKSITVEGHGDYWGPDIIEVRIAELRKFPKLLPEGN